MRSTLVLLLLAAALTMCFCTYPLQSHVSYRRAIHPKRSNAAAISLRFLEMMEEDGSSDTPKEEDEETAEWVLAMVKPENGIGKKTVKTVKEAIHKMCTESKATAILKAIKGRPLTEFTRGQKINAVLNVVIFYNLYYNTDKVVAIVKDTSKNKMATEKAIANKFSGFLVHPQLIGDEDALSAAFESAVGTLEQLHEKASNMIGDILKDEAMTSYSCFPARSRLISTALQEVLVTEEQKGHGIFYKRADTSTFVSDYVNKKLEKMFPDTAKDPDAYYTRSNVKAVFADKDVQKETGVAADSPRVAKITDYMAVIGMVE